MSVIKKRFGNLSDGREVFLYEMKNANGMTVVISEYGAAIVSLNVPDKKGRFLDVVCGYDDVQSYEHADGYQGAIVGRWANRIAEGKFELDGKKYSLTVNNGKNHLHGGAENPISSKLWKVDSVSEGGEPSLCLSCVSNDGDDGYPGTLYVTVTYTLLKDNALSIRYSAKTDKKTVVNLTNHAYFNLGGYDSGSVRDHLLTVFADSYLETDETLIPTGKLASVEGTPFDLRTPKRLGDAIDSNHKDIMLVGGYDHCFNFVGWEDESKEIRHRATLYCAETGIEMKVLTNSPCAQIYSGNVMNNANFPFKNGYAQNSHNAVCIETERMPDSMNHKGFTKCTLDVGETYDYTTVYKFNVK